MDNIKARWEAEAAIAQWTSEFDIRKRNISRLREKQHLHYFGRNRRCERCGLYQRYYHDEEFFNSGDPCLGVQNECFKYPDRASYWESVLESGSKRDFGDMLTVDQIKERKEDENREYDF